MALEKFYFFICLKSLVAVVKPGAIRHNHLKYDFIPAKKLRFFIKLESSVIMTHKIEDLENRRETI